MCGISAILFNAQKKEQTMTSMLNAIKHRGDSVPNNSKKDAFDADAILGNVRLKIVDIPNGKQPFYNENKTVAVTFNGEIYNHKILKKKLEKLGHTFISDCDTEVLVHLYEQYKEDMLTQEDMELDGMFAFVIFDRVTNKFLMARDRYGIKPLYYAEADNSIYVSSELKSFAKIKEIDEYKELLPSHYINDIRIEPKPYYRQEYEIDNSIDLGSAKSAVRKHVINAVKKRVIDTDLPIGMWLSGGIDSSIVFLIARQYHKDIRPIIIGKENSPDVSAAILLCNEVGSSYMHIDPTDEEILKIIPELIESIETFEPNPIRPSALTYFLAKETKRLELKVVLCGEGADEIFGGYGDFLLTQTDDECLKLTQNFVRDLYRTQLLRIDRVGMAFHVEVREPFMDNQLVNYAVGLKRDYKINRINGKILTKYILREAFKDILPEEIYLRDKQTIMAGAGVCSVEVEKGIFYENAQSKNKLLLKHYKEYDLKNEEDVYYFNTYKDHYMKALFNKERAFSAKREINDTVV